MSHPALKRLAILLGVLCAVLIVGSGFLFWSHSLLRIRATFADDQTQIFDEMRAQALRSDSPPDITGSLEYVVNYYPSGSKQQAGSTLDRVVERHRTAVLLDIISHLRNVTHEDLGASPEPWIKKYAQR